MSLSEQLKASGRFFLDTTPVIYFVENHPRYSALLAEVFSLLDNQACEALVSVVTLAECLVHPLRDGHRELAEKYRDLLERGESTSIRSIDAETAIDAARLRAVRKFSIADALQLAVASRSQCPIFLTNDRQLAQFTALRVLILDDFC